MSEETFGPGVGTAGAHIHPLRTAVVVGSTRRGRNGAAIGRWVAEQTAARGDMAVDMVDLVEAALPVVFPDFTEATEPEPVAALGTRLADADGFVVVTPEYNHGYPASLKNAVDWYYGVWNAKPVAFVSYGGRSGGIRAVEQLRQVFAEVHAATTRDGVTLELDRDIGPDGRPVPGGSAEASVKQMLDQLAWWTWALRSARTAHPYGT